MSPNNAEDPLEPASVPVLRPSVPKPTASSTTVHDFLVQFLLSQDWELTQDEAHEKARKIEVDGKTLYELPEKTLTDEFGIIGWTIYRALETSKYGYDGGYWPQLTVAGAVFFLMLLNGGWQLWNERNLRDYRIPIALTIVTAVLIIFNLFCKKLRARRQQTVSRTTQDQKKKCSKRTMRVVDVHQLAEDSVDSIRFQRLFSHDID